MKLWAILVGGGFAFVGIMLGYRCVDDIRQDKASFSWSTTPGEIVSASYSRPTTKWGYRVSVEYQYEVGGRRYRSHRVTRTGGGYNSEEKAREMLAKYAAGKRVTVFFPPNIPEASILEPRITKSNYFGIGLGAVAVVFGGFLGKWIFTGQSKKPKEDFFDDF